MGLLGLEEKEIFNLGNEIQSNRDDGQILISLIEVISRTEHDKDGHVHLWTAEFRE